MLGDSVLTRRRSYDSYLYAPPAVEWRHAATTRGPPPAVIEFARRHTFAAGAPRLRSLRRRRHVSMRLS